jgi:hypothetical protein
VLDAHEYEGHVSTVISQQRASERRDVHRTIDLWQRNVTADSVLPLLSTFDFSSMKSNWGHRFLICSDPNVENAAFMMYGAKFAQQLDLPEKELSSRSSNRSLSGTGASSLTVATRQ